MRDQLRKFLFHIHTSDAVAIFLLAAEEKKYDWVSTVTISGLIAWILLSFVLLLEFREYLVERAPWTIIAVLGPVSIWSAIVATKEIDFYYAGLFTPAWIGVGLIILAVYDGRKCPGRLEGAGKDQVDVERGIARRNSHGDGTGGAAANRRTQSPKPSRKSSRGLYSTPPMRHPVAGTGRRATMQSAKVDQAGPHGVSFWNSTFRR